MLFGPEFVYALSQVLQHGLVEREHYPLCLTLLHVDVHYLSAGYSQTEPEDVSHPSVTTQRERG